MEDKIRSREFETRNLADRYQFFEKMVRKQKDGGKDFRAKFPTMRFDSSVQSLDMQELMIEIRERESLSRLGLCRGGCRGILKLCLAMSMLNP